MKYALVTFAEGHFYKQAAKRLVREATQSGYFREVRVYTLKSLLSKGLVTPKIEKFSKENPTGKGFWIWKPLIIKHEIENLSNTYQGLTYLDAGCTLNFSQSARSRFTKYTELAHQNGLLGFQMELPEHDWTKADLINRVGSSEGDINSGQIMGGVNFWERNNFSLDFINEWIKISQEADMHYIDNSPSRISEIPSFKAHRNDQSIFSLLAKKYEATTITDETYWDPDWLLSGKDFPIWTTRHASKINYRSVHENFVLKKINLLENMVRGSKFYSSYLRK